MNHTTRCSFLHPFPSLTKSPEERRVLYVSSCRRYNSPMSEFQDSLKEHNRNPILILLGIRYLILHEELHSFPKTTVINSDSIPGLSTTPSSSSTSTQQHACSLPAHSPSSPYVSQLCLYEGLEQVVDRAAPAPRRSLPGSSTGHCGHDVCPVLNTLGGNTSRDSTPVEGVQNSRRWCLMCCHGGPSLPVPLPTLSQSK